MPGLCANSFTRKFIHIDTSSLCINNAGPKSSGTAQNLSSTSCFYDQTGVTGTVGTPQQALVTGSRGNLTTVATQANGSTTLYRTFPTLSPSRT